MDGKLPISRHFFKVMMPGFLKQLSVPKAFCMRLSGEKSKEAVLSSSKGLWNVKIAKSSYGIIWFREGWDSFVHHHGLEMGDFLVFEHKGNLHFEVLVFEPSACERDFPLKMENERKRAHSGANCQENVKHMKRESSLLGTSAADQSQGNPHFIATIKPTNTNPRFPYMHIPSEFMKSNDLGEIGNIILRDPSGKSWLVKLLKRRNETKFQRTSMGKGWYEFYVSNNLKKGDVCVFELDGAARRSPNTAVMDVQICRRPN